MAGPQGDVGGDGDDRDLALRARADADAFAALYRRHVGAVHAFAQRRTGSREAADDVTATTFERAWRAMPGFEWRGGGFRPWLFAIAAGEVAAWFRGEARTRRPRAAPALAALSGDAPAVEDIARLDDDRAARALRTALGRLPERYQVALSLRHVAGLSNDEAAAAMGCSRSVMAVTTHRAVAALRRELDRTGEPRP